MSKKVNEAEETKKVTTEKATAEIVTTEKATTEQPTVETATTENATIEKPTAETAITETTTTEMIATEPATTEIEVVETPENAKTALVERNASFQPDEVKQYRNRCDKIQKEVKKIEYAYLTIALELYNIYQKQLYKIDNYPNIYDMAYDMFSLGRATCNNYINICKNFGKIDKAKKECTGLLPEYEKFCASKLVVMMNMPEELRKEITPDMSVRDIKRKKQIYEERKNLSDNSSGNAEETTKKSEGKKAIELLRTNNIVELIEKDNSLLLEKYDSIMKEYPDTKYTISITLIPKE